MVFVIKDFFTKEVYTLDVPDEEALLLNINPEDSVWVEGNPEAPDWASQQDNSEIITDE